MKNQIIEKYIMLADDDIDDRMLFEEALRELCEKSRFVTSIDGYDLLNTLNNTSPPPPDVIFLDINMPKLDGLECLTKIKNNPSYKDIPVIIFSTSSNQENIEKAKLIGASYYIKKPTNFKSLKDIISKVCELITEPVNPAQEFFISI